MASNRIQKSYNPVVQLLEDAADGAHTYGAIVGLKQNDEPALRAALTALVDTPAGPRNVPPAVPGPEGQMEHGEDEQGGRHGRFARRGA